MHAPPSNPLSLTPQAEDIARKSGNEKIVFWTSVASLGLMGVMATSMAAHLVFDLVRRGRSGRQGEPEQHGGHWRGRE